MSKHIMSTAGRGYPTHVVATSNSKVPRRSGLALVVLALLAEAPMNPYRMQRLIRERGNDTVVNIAHRNSLTQTVERLRRDGQIEIQETQRDGNRPERTIYRITDAGHATLRQWMSQILSTPPKEFPETPAALSLIALFPPSEIQHWLQRRITELHRRLAAITTNIPGLPRVFLIEEEYKRALLEAERRWIQQITTEIDNGTLHWDPELLRTPATPAAPQHAP